MDHVAAPAGPPARVVEAVPDDVVTSRLARRPRRRVDDVLDLPAVSPPPDIVRVDPARLVAEQQESPDQPALRVRSEEHTSELQSLMRISYAVFCLKKKT